MSSTTIRDALSRKKSQNPQFDFLWRIELPQLDSLTGDALSTGLGIASSIAPSLSSGISGAISAFGQATNLFNQASSIISQDDVAELNHRVYSFSAPFKSFDTQKVIRGTSFVYNAMQSDIGAVSMTVDEMEDGKTLEYFDKWMGLIESQDGTAHNVPAFYKRDIRYIKMSASKLDLHYSIYKGYFPTEISPIENNYDGNGIMQYNVTLTGDSVRHVIIPESQVVAMISSEEEAILRKQFTSSGFRLGSIDTSRAARVLDNVIDAFS